jgi:hypothetical protein
MRKSVLGLPQQKPREKKKALKGARRRDKMKFAAVSGLLILILRTTKARCKGGVREDVRKKFLNPTKKMSQTADHEEKELTKKSRLMKALDGKIVMSQGLIDRDVIRRSLGTMSLGITAKRRR